MYVSARCVCAYVWPRRMCVGDPVLGIAIYRFVVERVDGNLKFGGVLNRSHCVANY